MLKLVQKQPVWSCAVVAAVCFFTICHAATNAVADLDEKTWDRMLTGEWMVEL